MLNFFLSKIPISPLTKILFTSKPNTSKSNQYNFEKKSPDGFSEFLFQKIFFHRILKKIYGAILSNDGLNCVFMSSETLDN